MDELLRNAIAKRDKLRADLAALDTFIQAYGKTLDDTRVSVQHGNHPDLFERVPNTRANRLRAVGQLLDEAEGMILAAGKPMTRGELVPALQRAGHHLEGSDPNKVFGTNMWRSGRFHSLKGAGYWPKREPLPAAYADLEKRSSIVE